MLLRKNKISKRILILFPHGANGANVQKNVGEPKLELIRVRVMNKLKSVTSFQPVPDLVNKDSIFFIQRPIKTVIQSYLSIGYGHVQFNRLPTVTTSTYRHQRYESC